LPAAWSRETGKLVQALLRIRGELIEHAPESCDRLRVMLGRRHGRAGEHRNSGGTGCKGGCGALGL